MKTAKRLTALILILALIGTLGIHNGLTIEVRAAEKLKPIAGNVAQVAMSNEDYGDSIAILFTDGTVRANVPEQDVLYWTDVIEVYTAYFEWSEDADSAYQGNADGYHKGVVALRSDGTVVSNYMDLSDWSDIQKIVTFDNSVLGIRKDGTVVTRGKALEDPEYEFDFSDWNNIQDVVIRWGFAVGLKKDGTAVITGRYTKLSAFDDFTQNVNGWRNIATIMRGHGGVYAIDKNGKVYQTDADDLPTLRHCVNKWKNIKKLMPAYVGEGYYGLTKDGTALVSVLGGEMYTAFKNVVDIAVAEATKLVGLKADGTIIFEKGSYYAEDGYVNEPGDMDQWTNIVKLIGNRSGFFVGLKADGTAVASRDNEIISKWENLKDIFINSDGTVIGIQKNGALLCNTYDMSSLDEKAVKKPIQVEKNTNAIISAGAYHSVMIKSDGTVIGIGRKDNERLAVDEWKDIVAVSASSHTLGLCSDGTVVAAGSNAAKQCDVSDWTDIIAISASTQHSLGLCADGTVVAAGTNAAKQCDVSDWTDIVAITTGEKNSYGLVSDGTVLATGSNASGQNNVRDWEGIVAISSGVQHVVGLKADGTVVAVGSNGYGQCKVSDWTDIIAISAGSNYTLGLKSDGTVVAVGDNSYGKCDVQDWKNVVAISAGMSHSIGLRSDGRVLSAGSNTYGQCDGTIRLK